MMTNQNKQSVYLGVRYSTNPNVERPTRAVLALSPDLNRRILRLMDVREKEDLSIIEFSCDDLRFLTGRTTYLTKGQKLVLTDKSIWGKADHFKHNCTFRTESLTHSQILKAITKTAILVNG